MQPPQGLIVDLDDTILDTTDSSTRVWRASAAHFAPEIGHPPHTINLAIDKARDWYWADPERNAKGRLDLIQARTDVVALALRDLGKDDTDLAQRFSDHYTDHRIDAMQPFPGAIETLRAFKRRGTRLALISNGHGPSQRAKVQRFDLDKLFDAVLIEGEIGMGKPDPGIYQQALQHLGTAPGDTWVVGDNLEWEVAAPQALGMHAVWVDFAGTGLPPGSPIQPDRIVRSLADLLD